MERGEELNVDIIVKVSREKHILCVENVEQLSRRGKGIKFIEKISSVVSCLVSDFGYYLVYFCSWRYIIALKRKITLKNWSSDSLLLFGIILLIFFLIEILILIVYIQVLKSV